MRVVTYNIWNGGEDRIGAIEDVLRALDADVVALQEASNRAAVEAMARQLGMQLIYGAANSEWAIAWLSRLPILRSRNHRLPVLAKTLLEIEVEGAQLFATHLVHGHSRQDASRRTAEVRAILELVKPGSILTGDFNAAHPQDEVGEPPPPERLGFIARRPIELILNAGFRDCYRELHADRGWTYETSHPWFRPDHIFAAPGLRIERCEVVTDAGGASDHFPVVADVT